MKLLLYTTKQPPYLFNQNIYEFYDSEYITSTHKFHEKQDYLLNGKIVAECDFEVEDLRIVDDDPLGAYWYETKTLSENEVLEESCLTSDELFEYLGEDNEGYAIHIKNLHIFDKSKELKEYSYYYKRLLYTKITEAPQNMMYAFQDNFEERKTDEYILISIRPEWLCKILNGEKTIEVRKKVLKGMLK